MTEFTRALDIASSHPDDDADVEGPISIFCNSASACLPHLIQHDSGGPNNVSSSLFALIMVALWDVCASLCHDSQVLSYRPINTVHAALNEEMRRASTEIQDYAINFIFQLRLMLTFLRYPQKIFSKGVNSGLLLWQVRKFSKEYVYNFQLFFLY